MEKSHIYILDSQKQSLLIKSFWNKYYSLNISRKDRIVETQKHVSIDNAKNITNKSLKTFGSTFT